MDLTSVAAGLQSLSPLEASVVRCMCRSDWGVVLARGRCAAPCSASAASGSSRPARPAAFFVVDMAKKAALTATMKALEKAPSAPSKLATLVTSNLCKMLYFARQARLLGRGFLLDLWRRHAAAACTQE